MQSAIGRRCYEFLRRRRERAVKVKEDAPCILVDGQQFVVRYESEAQISWSGNSAFIMRRKRKGNILVIRLALCEYPLSLALAD